MNSNELIQILTVIRDRLRHVLESDASRVLDETISNIRTSKEKFDEYQGRHDLVDKPVTDWGYEIFKTPLRFQISTYNNYRLRADILCNIRWESENSVPYRQEVVLRVWSNDPEVMYRPYLDSEEIGERVTGQNSIKERVMLRCHFDLANVSQDGPKYHLQIGGSAIESEYCWFPKELDLPRLIHCPLEIVLLCQIIVANFFPEEYKKIRKDPTWVGAVKKVEKHLLKEYYQNCLDAITSKRTLLDDLWNIQG